MSRIRSRLYGGLVQVLVVTLLVGPLTGPAPVAAAAQVSLPAQPASGLALSITRATEPPMPVLPWPPTTVQQPLPTQGILT